MNKFRYLRKNNSIFLGLTVFLFFIIFTSFNDDDDFSLAKNMEIYYELIRDLNKFYVDDINVEKSITTSITQMLETLDPYTVYYPESQIEDYRLLTTGQYGGIGALMRSEGNKIVIDEIFENYPADKAGFKVGDVITSVEGKEANSATYDKVSELMKGMPDTELEITVYRPIDNKHYTKRLVRERIINKSVSYHGMLTDKVGYIKLESFTLKAYDEVKSAFIDLKSKKMKKLVFDLRNNPGGLLMESVKILGMFLDKGTQVVTTKGKMKKWNSCYRTPNDPEDTEIPIVVLVTRNSASASEIISGAMQDLDRGVVLGERTFGKGLVQTTLDLSYNSKIKLTTARYYIPSGRCIQALDYLNRNPDGSVGHIPDSLISEFKTLNGRIVYDGGGVIPDVSVDSEELSSITSYLLENMIIFDFATKYVANHTSIIGADKFQISEEDYKMFVNFATSKNISYKTETELQIEQLVKVAKKEKYYSKAKSEIDVLKKKLSHTVKEDMEFFKDQIKKMLTTEIVRRYYYKKGAVINMLANNEYIKQSISILNDNKRYNSILNIKNN